MIKPALNSFIRPGFLLAFGELFLKSPGVQAYLRRRLLNNLSLSLKKQGVDSSLLNWHERVFVGTECFGKTELVLKRTFGIAWFSRAYFFKKDGLKALEDFVKDNYPNWLKKNQTFGLRVKVQGRKEAKEEVIDKIAKHIKRKVDLTRPHKEIFIEGRKDGWFLYFAKKRGLGGLPSASQGKVLCLISGGIDSVVAGFLVAKRGAQNVWLHFHSFPLTSQQSLEKVRALAKVFLSYQSGLKVYFLPFSQVQTKIKANVLANHRVLFYRALMFEIARRIAEKENCGALVTGEALGQVSSQTLANLKIVQKDVALPVLRPLIGFDKQEIIMLAKKLGTFEISSRPQEDCCTLFVPKHQTAAANPKIFDALKNKLKIKKEIALALKELRVENF